MTLAFIKQINEYVIDAIQEASDEEVLASIGTEGYPSHEDIQRANATIVQAIKEQQQNRLSQNKAAFQAYKKEQEGLKATPLTRPISEMLGDIVATLQNKDKVPEGLILAFREQSQGGSEDDIAKIWQSLVELGLINPNDTNS